jgi:hypothetical protein
MSVSMGDPGYERGFQLEGVEIWVIIINARSDQRKGTLRYEVPAYQTTLSAITSLALQTSIESPIKQPLVAVVNGTTADMTYILQPGDKVQFVSYLAAGAIRSAQSRISAAWRELIVSLFMPGRLARNQTMRVSRKETWSSSRPLPSIELPAWLPATATKRSMRRRQGKAR